jgi:hypothetical protein
MKGSSQFTFCQFRSLSGKEKEAPQETYLPITRTLPSPCLRPVVLIHVLNSGDFTREDLLKWAATLVGIHRRRLAPKLPTQPNELANAEL